MTTRIEKGILQSKELDLLAYVVMKREMAFAWEQSERGSFSREYFPDYEIPTIEHVPWHTKPIRIADSLVSDVKDEIRKGEAAGRFEPTTSSYRSPLFAVKKKSGVRLVINLEELNSVTIQDSALPPNISDFAASYIGYAMYGLADLFSGFDARWVAVRSRPMFAFSSPLGARQQATLVQGYTNSIPEFQRCADHSLESVSSFATAFIDDCGIKGPTSRYGDEEIHPGIRRFVWEYFRNLDRVLGALINAGITASGAKAILAAEHLKIVGSVVCLDGWIIEPSLVAKIANYPQPESTTEIRGFLGVSGVGRRWMEKYAVIAKPLTILLRDLSERDFLFPLDAVQAFEHLKHLASSAPVIIAIDYEAAKRITQLPRENDEGLVILGVDGSWIGAGWALYQIRETLKRPAGFGSCTFSEREQNYGQPKTELYSVFRAFKELRHRIWGIRFRLDHDAISLAKMIRDPDDVPNAPMLRWVSWMRLFNFYMHHVPATAHKAEDGMSRRRHVPGEEIEGEEVQEEFLEAFINTIYGCSKGSLERGHALPSAEHVLHLLSIAFSPSYDDSWRKASVTPYIGKSSALQTELLVDQTRSKELVRFLPENMERKTQAKRQEWFRLGEELIPVEFTQYEAYSTHVTSKNMQSGLAKPHNFKVLDADHPTMWKEVKTYLESGTFPSYCVGEKNRIAFFKRVRRFFLRDDRIWLTPKANTGELPRLVVEDVPRRGELMALAHTECGHRGRDATYRHLYDRFYWPNMYDAVSYFVRSCIECQKLIKHIPIVPYNISWQSPLLRHFNLDCIHMPPGVGGFKYIVQALEPTILWPEAKALKTLTAAAVAKFIYQDLICRFGCIPSISMDAGSEFKREVKELLSSLYRCEIVVSTPYHPQGNAPVERAHIPLVEAIVKAAGDAIGRWPSLLHPALFAIRITTSRATGFAPYFLLYGVHPVLSFDLSELTWQTLDWHLVSTTTELLALRTLQLERRDPKLREANLKLRVTRQRAVDDHAKRYGHQFAFHDYQEGMYVWLRESQLETQQGNKSDWTYSGPYVIHAKRETGSFVLRELDGTILRGHVNAQRLRLFFYRPENQTLRTEIPSRPKIRQAKVTAIECFSHDQVFCFVRDSAQRAFDNGTTSSGTVYSIGRFL